MENNARVSMTMHPATLERVDEYARLVGISRSAAISVLVVSALQQEEFLRRFPEFMVAVGEQQRIQSREVAQAVEMAEGNG